MVRTNFLAQLRAALAGYDQYFDPLDFDISQPKPRDGRSGVRIAYLYDTTYSYAFSFRNAPKVTKDHDGILTRSEVDYEVSVTCRPGKFGAEESWGFRSPESVISDVSEWVGRIRDEIRSQPTAREVERQQEQLDELRQRLAETGARLDEHFSVDERDQVMARLDELQQQMEASAAEHAKDKAALNDELRGLRKDFDTLRDMLRANASRAAWFTAAAVRAGKWAAGPGRPLLAAGQEFVKALLPGPSTPPG